MIIIIINFIIIIVNVIIIVVVNIDLSSLVIFMRRLLTHKV